MARWGNVKARWTGSTPIVAATAGQTPEARTLFAAREKV